MAEMPVPILIKVEFDYFFFRDCRDAQFPLEHLYTRQPGDMEHRWQICYRFGQGQCGEHLDCFVWAPVCSHSIVRVRDNGTHEILAVHDSETGLMVLTDCQLPGGPHKNIFALASALGLTHSRLPMLRMA